MSEPTLQLSLFGAKNPMLEELETLDVNAPSPLEALNRLFEWKKKAGKYKLQVADGQSSRA